MIHFVDIETTGLDPYRSEVIEIGIVSAAHGNTTGMFECSLPFDENRASPKALEVNGWGKRPFPPQLSVDEALDKMEEIFEDNGAFCAWHVAFDEAFLHNLWRTHRDGKPAPWSHSRVIDLPSLVMGRLGVLASGSQRTLLPQLRLDDEFEGKHTALVDAEANLRIYNELKLYEVI